MAERSWATVLPDDALPRYLGNTRTRLADWRRSLTEHEARLQIARLQVGNLLREESELLREMDAREIPADFPGHESHASGPTDCDCQYREAILDGDGIRCGTCGHRIVPEPDVSRTSGVS